jgi:hypothetical protein
LPNSCQIKPALEAIQPAASLFDHFFAMLPGLVGAEFVDELNSISERSTVLGAAKHHWMTVVRPRKLKSVSCLRQARLWYTEQCEPLKGINLFPMLLQLVTATQRKF